MYSENSHSATRARGGALTGRFYELLESRWMSSGQRRPWLAALVGVVAEICVLTPFAFGDPTPYFGMPGALATAVAIVVAVTAGLVPALITATGAGLFFVTLVANPPHQISGPASVATAFIWIGIAAIAGSAAGGLRRRLATSFAELESREMRVHDTLESTAAAVGLFSGPDLRCDDANARLRGLFARRGADGGQGWHDRPLAGLLPDLPADVLDALLACATATGAEVQRNEVRLADDGPVVALTAHCLADATGHVLHLTLTDVTASVRLRRDIERVLAIFSGLALTASPAQVAAELCSTAIGLFGCSTTSFWSVEGDDVRLLARAPETVSEDRWTLDELADLGGVVRSGQPLFVSDVHVHFAATDPGPSERPTKLQAYFKARGYRSLLALPVAYGSQVGSLLFFAWTEPIDRPGEELLSVARRFADEAAIAIERAERMAAEREAARLHRRLEESLLPKMAVQSERLAVDYRYVPGERHLLIGGDFLDTATRPDGSICLIIGDVTGHGPDAAALGAMLRAAWHGLAMQGTPFDELLSRLNDVLTAERAEDGQFATVCLACVAATEARLTLALAGHPQPLLATPNDVVEVAARHGVPLGVSDDPEWPVTTVDLPPAWSLLFYTDGLPDCFAFARGRQRVGLSGVLALIEQARGGGRDPAETSPQDRADPLTIEQLDDVLDHVRRVGRRAADDLAVLLVRPKLAAMTPGAGPAIAEPDVLEVSFASRGASAGELRGVFSAYLARHAISGRPEQQAVLCAEEALTNAILHAGDDDGRIVVSAQVSDDAVVVEVSDSGCGFDVRTLDLEATPDPLKVGGRGLFLIRHLADDVEIVSGGHGTTVRMLLRLDDSREQPRRLTPVHTG